MGKAFDIIRQGLDESIAHAQGKSVAAIIHHPRDVDVAALRKRIGMILRKYSWPRGHRGEGRASDGDSGSCETIGVQLWRAPQEIE